MARGLRRRCPRKPTARQVRPGRRARCPTASAETVLPSQTPASIPSRAWRLAWQSGSAGHLLPEARPPEARRHHVTGVSDFEQNTDSVPGWEGSLGRAAQMTGEGETGSLIGWGGGIRPCPEGGPLYLVTSMGSSLLGVASFLSGLVGEAAERREAERTGERRHGEGARGR